MDEVNESSPVAQAIASLGGASSVARLLVLTPWAISKWITDGVPAKRVLWLSEQTNWKWTPHQLAPRLYPHPDDGLPVAHRGDGIASGASSGARAGA